MRALDLFCGAGGAGVGLSRAGFEVVGVDLERQPSNPLPTIRADALAPPVELAGFDLVWASPPCQRFSAYRRRGDGVGATAPDLIDPVRTMLRASGVPYIIENVPGAPLDPARTVQLCGSSFGLDVRRHRLFECSFPVLVPPCSHQLQAPRFPCATNRTNLRRTVEVGVWRIPLDTQKRAMGVDWPISLPALSQAIPPAYSEFLARAFVEAA